MTKHIVNELDLSINQKSLEEQLIKLDALLKIGMDSELYNKSADVVYGYLWALSDITSEAMRFL